MLREGLIKRCTLYFSFGGGVKWC